MLIQYKLILKSKYITDICKDKGNLCFDTRKKDSMVMSNEKAAIVQFWESCLNQFVYILFSRWRIDWIGCVWFMIESFWTILFLWKISKSPKLLPQKVSFLKIGSKIFFFRYSKRCCWNWMNHDFENKLWIMFEFSKAEIKSNTFYKIFMWRKFHNLCKELLNTAPNRLEDVLTMETNLCWRHRNHINILWNWSLTTKFIA